MVCRENFNSVRPYREPPSFVIERKLPSHPSFFYLLPKTATWSQSWKNTNEQRRRVGGEGQSREEGARKREVGRGEGGVLRKRQEGIRERKDEEKRKIEKEQRYIRSGQGGGGEPGR